MTNAEKIAKDISKNIDFMIEFLLYFDCCNSTLSCKACLFHKTPACIDGTVSISNLRKWLESEA